MAPPKRTPHPLAVAVAANVRAYAGIARLNATDLAAELGTTRQRVTRWMNGDVAIDVDDLGRLADALGVDPVALLAPSPGRNE